MLAECQMTIDDYNVWDIVDTFSQIVDRIERESLIDAENSKVTCLTRAYQNLAERCSQYDSNRSHDEAKMATEILSAGQEYIRFFEANPEYVRLRDEEDSEDDSDIDEE